MWLDTGSFGFTPVCLEQVTTLAEPYKPVEFIDIYIKYVLVCLSSAKLRSTDSVDPRAVLSRVRPRYRLYSRHRDIDGMSTVPIPVCLLDASCDLS
jgi:hypothetical protein